MQIEVKSNPNCRESDQFVFNELEPARPIHGLRVGPTGQESECDVVGVVSPGQFVTAHAAKITDSGAGYAYVIFGGDWGIRLRPRAQAGEVWDLANPRQWGEPFKIYGSEGDILYADGGKA